MSDRFINTVNGRLSVRKIIEALNDIIEACQDPDTAERLKAVIDGIAETDDRV